MTLLSKVVDEGMASIKHGKASEIKAGAEFIKKLVEESWERAGFRELAADIAQDVSTARTAPNVRINSDWSDPRVVHRGDKETYVELPPVINALIKSDRAIWQPKSQIGDYLDPKNLEFNEGSTGKLSDSIGLAPKSLRYDPTTGRVQMRLSDPAAASVATHSKFAMLQRNQFGVTPGYLTDRKAIDAIWRRYTPRQAPLTISAYPEEAYHPIQLRLIERHLGLPESSFHYQNNDLVFIPPTGFTHEPLMPAANPAETYTEPGRALPFRSKLSHDLEEYKKINFHLDGTTFPLYDRKNDHAYFYPENWKGSGTHAGSHFKLRLLADNGADFGRVHDVFIPRLYEDPEFKELLLNWKVSNPFNRNRSDVLTEENGKAVTFYPASMRTLPRLYEKLDLIIQKVAPDLIATEAPKTLAADRLLGSTNRISIVRERCPGYTNGFVPLDREVTNRFASDKDLPPFSNKSRVAALEELTGIEPGDLSLLQDGRLAVRAPDTPSNPDSAYVRDGKALRRSVGNDGYTGRWAMHLVGGRYDVDPLKFPIPRVF